MGRIPGGPALVCLTAWLILPHGLRAADSGQELLDAAAQGRTAKVQALVDQGVSLAAKDKNGRTALMLAAQHGHAPTVRFLLEKGADATVRDQHGATAWVLTMFSPSGARGAIDEVLKILPPPPRPRLVVEAGWSTANLYSSCTMRLDRLTQQVSELQPDLLALTAFRRFAATSGKELVEIVSADARGVMAVPTEEAFAGTERDAVLVLEVRPAAACQPQQSVDNLGLTIEMQLVRAKDRALLLRKTFGGGVKGLHTRTVTNQAQYFPVYQEWVKAHVEQIYWAAVEAWFRQENP
jgi:hypothetical protein